MDVSVSGEILGELHAQASVGNRVGLREQGQHGRKPAGDRHGERPGRADDRARRGDLRGGMGLAPADDLRHGDRAARRDDRRGRDIVVRHFIGPHGEDGSKA